MQIHEGNCGEIAVFIKAKARNHSWMTWPLRTPAPLYEKLSWQCDQHTRISHNIMITCLILTSYFLCSQKSCDQPGQTITECLVTRKRSFGPCWGLCRSELLSRFPSNWYLSHFETKQTPKTLCCVFFFFPQFLKLFSCWRRFLLQGNDFTMLEGVTGLQESRGRSQFGCQNAVFPSCQWPQC